jgi:hypothetical protein
VNPFEFVSIDCGTFWDFSLSSPIAARNLACHLNASAVCSQRQKQQPRKNDGGNLEFLLIARGEKSDFIGNLVSQFATVYNSFGWFMDTINSVTREN